MLSGNNKFSDLFTDTNRRLPSAIFAGKIGSQLGEIKTIGENPNATSQSPLGEIVRNLFIISQMRVTKIVKHNVFLSPAAAPPIFLPAGGLY